MSHSAIALLCIYKYIYIYISFTPVWLVIYAVFDGSIRSFRWYYVQGNCLELVQ